MRGSGVPRLVTVGQALLVVAGTSGCFSRPPPPAVTDATESTDGASDPLPLRPRLIANAYYADNAGNPHASAGMTKDHFEVPTVGIHPGDLVLFIASVDNGAPGMWPVRDAAFTEIAQQFYNGDQTFVVAWRIATAAETATYGGNYTSTGGSGAATISLVAVSGVDPIAPINGVALNTGVPPTISPVVGAVPDVALTAPGCTLIYA